MMVSIVLIFFTSGKVIAQDIIFERTDLQWFSPTFSTTGDSRIEWKTFPIEGATDPTFELFLVEEQTQNIIFTSTALQGISPIDKAFCHIEIVANQLSSWVVKLFYLDQVPFSTTNPPDPVTTSNPPTPIMTHTITIAVFTTLPPEARLVTSSFFLVGVFMGIIGVLTVMFAIVSRNIDISINKRIPEQKEDPPTEEGA